MKPNKKNFCGGNYQDWLEVMLIEKCNGRCSWCIEKAGFKPEIRASWETLAGQIMESGQPNIVLLGGEPTLYPELKELVSYLARYHRRVYLTTNGSKLSPEFVKENMAGITGVNISIHDILLSVNTSVTGIYLEKKNLKATIASLSSFGATVRLNCNLIRRHIDSEAELLAYIEFAKDLGSTNVRFAELRNDPENFVDLNSIFGDRYGLNNDPFTLGCNTDAVINGMAVNFRQMCGLQTPLREAPTEPEQAAKKVLYYDGKFYDGWQTEKESVMTERQVLDLLINVQDGDVSVIEAAQRIMSQDGLAANKPESTLPPCPPSKDVERTGGQILRRSGGESSVGSTGCQY